MLNDWTEIRNTKEQKRRWLRAAGGKELSSWIRDNLDADADRDLRSPKSK